MGGGPRVGPPCSQPSPEKPTKRIASLDTSLEPGRSGKGWQLLAGDVHGAGEHAA